MMHKYFLQVTTPMWHKIAILVVLAQLLTTLVWIECDEPDGSYFLEWWGHIFGFCAKSHIIIYFLSEPVSLFILMGCIAFQFFFWVIIDGLFSLPWIFSIDLSFYWKPKRDLSFYLPHPCFIIHALRSAYHIISLLYNFSFFLSWLVAKSIYRSEVKNIAI